MPIPIKDRNFNLEVIFTGNETETGGRIYKIRDRIEEDTFIVSYGDCLANVDLDGLMNFHKNKRIVRTTSSIQVRQKIYQGSSEEWKKYKDYLKPLINGLKKS